MDALRRRLRPATWLALVAMLALALAPTLSHALAHLRGEPGALAEICTPQGMKRIGGASAALAAGETPPAGPLAGSEHCPFCMLPGAPGLPPPVATPALALLPLSHAEPALFLQAPRTLFAWAAAPPRGPPSRS